MADFCLTCAINTLGFDTRDLAAMTTPDDTAAGRFTLALCEGCGPIQVDHNGRRIALPNGVPHRPRVLNKKTDRIPPGAKYCGRPSPFGNPFVIGRDGTREQVIRKYEKWLPTQPKLMAMIPSLAGRDLVCWCAPERCHCDFLLRLANPHLFCTG